jgi:hypothetical protein
MFNWRWMKKGLEEGAAAFPFDPFRKGGFFFYPT